MKILHVSHGCLPEMSGGIETYLDAVVRAQHRRGDQVEILAGSHELRPETVIETGALPGLPDVPVHRLYRDDLYFDLWSKAYHAGAALAFDALLERSRPDVIHVHQWIRLTHDLVAIAARRGIPAVVTTHDVYTSCPRCFRVKPPDDSSCAARLSTDNCVPCVPRFGHETEREVAFGVDLYRDQMRAELGMAAKVLVASEATRDLITGTTEIPAEWFETMPLPYEPRFAGSPRAEPASDAPVRFAYWGVLTHRKGAHVLAAAFAQLCREGLSRPAELHLFGGVDTETLDAELTEITRGCPVTRHGRYEYDELAAAGLHVGVFPMLCFETWGFVLDECYELGMPCITTHNGALSQRAGDAALRVPQGDVAALRDAMRSLVDDPAAIPRLRAAIPAPSPTEAEHVERLAGIYSDAVASGPGDRAEPVGAARRARWLELQRESALGRIIPPEGPK